MQVRTSSNTDRGATPEESAAPDRQDSPPRRPRPFVTPGAGRWQTLASLAGLLLASTCFMPAVQSCNAPLIPFQDFYEGAADVANKPITVDTVIYLVFGFCMFILAYSFGGLEALAAILRMTKLKTWSQCVGRGTNVFLWGIVVLYISIVVYDCVGYWSSSWESYALGIGISALILVHLWRSRKLASRRWLAQSFLGSLTCFLWFSYWLFASLIGGGGLYGLTLSWIASTLLLLATVGEARAVARTSWFMTVLLLIISRLPEGYHSGHCPQCDYNLYGLPEPRCPECGRPFTPEEAAAAKP